MQDILKSDYRTNNVDITRRGQVLDINMTYPGWQEGDEPERVRVVEINQESVRASDGVRLSYDYQRDGWSIQQPKCTDRFVETKGGIDCYETDEEWIETAFVQSWAFGDPDDNMPD